MLEIKIAVAKTNKYAVSEGGDCLEITERPRGGLSVILADAQGSGKSARTNSKLIVSKCVALIGEGARDGAVARTVHDMLYSLRDGRVSATLTIASADLESMSLVISQNAGPPVFLRQEDSVHILDSGAQPIGVHRSMKPNISEYALSEGLAVVGMTDGVYAAGKYKGEPWRDDELQELILKHCGSPDFLARHLLEDSVRRDKNRPNDDMAVFVLYIGTYDSDIKIRTMAATLPC